MSDSESPPLGPEQTQQSSSGKWDVQTEDVAQTIMHELPEGIPPGLPKEMWLEYLFRHEKMKLDADNERKRIEMEAEVNFKRLELKRANYHQILVGLLKF